MGSSRVLCRHLCAVHEAEERSQDMGKAGEGKERSQDMGKAGEGKKDPRTWGRRVRVRVRRKT